MDINETLLRGIHPYQAYYGWKNERLTRLFSNQNFIHRRTTAINLIKEIMNDHGKGTLISTLNRLASTEYGVRELQPWVRDHVVHAVLSFILGIYINEKYSKLKKHQITPFQWKITGLFHDIGYPLEISSNISDPYIKTINSIRKHIDTNSSDVNIVSQLNLEKLSNKVNGFNLIQQQISGWGLKIDVENEYIQSMQSGKTCHGIISSITLLNIIDLMYQQKNPRRKYEDIIENNVNWNQKFFDQDIVPACSAIYLHNLSSTCFEDKKIDIKKAPLAYLLKISDILQEWERPKKEDTMGISASNFDIRIVDEQILFTANISENRKKEIIEDINSSIHNPEIIII